MPCLGLLAALAYPRLDQGVFYLREDYRHLYGSLGQASGSKLYQMAAE